MKIVDFGKFGKKDVHKKSFTFELYKAIVPRGTFEMYKELIKEEKEKQIIYTDEVVDFVEIPKKSKKK